MCVPSRNIVLCFCLWNPPTASLPNCISARRVASWRETQRISFHSSSCALVPVGVVNLATCVCIKSEEERPGEKPPSLIFWIWTAIPSSTAQSYIQHLEESSFLNKTTVWLKTCRLQVFFFGAFFVLCEAWQHLSAFVVIVWKKQHQLLLLCLEKTWVEQIMTNLLRIFSFFGFNSQTSL